ELTVLRPCQIYGPGDRRFLPRICALARDPDLLFFGDASIVVDLVHVGDVVQAALLAERAPASLSGRAYNVTDGAATPVAKFLAFLCERLGVARRIHAAPAGLARAIAAARSLARAVRSLGRTRRPYRAVMLRDLARHRHLDVGRARRELGYEPSIALED